MKYATTGIGLMSGTSLDGLDIAYCAFTKEDNQYRYNVIAAETLVYDDQWRQRLTFDPNLSGYDLKLLDLQYGTWLGETVAGFIERHQATPDFIASHGHTWFHEPENRLNLQIGDGYEIHRITKVPVINDFRSLDIRLGGQGAPLVPVGDHLLFSEYDCCINLGGIANISGLQGSKRISFDIAPFNLVLNKLAAREGLDYDEGGQLAASGKEIPTLSNAINKLPYFQQSPPKSLGIEWISEEIFPLLEDLGSSRTADLLHTYVQFVTGEMARSLSCFDRQERILVTGGGARNHYFIECLKQQTGQGVTIEVPDELLIDFKEAIVFAFLGLLRSNYEVNCLREVTGASLSVSGGVVYDQLVRGK